MQTSENNRAGELKDLGWSPEDVRKYEELWEYRQRWGAINLEREDRLFLRKAEAALPKLSSGRGSEKKRLQDKSHYRDRKSTRLNSSHVSESRMPSSA